MPTLGKKLNVSIGGTEDINTPISRSRSPMGGTKSPKLPKSKNGELSLNSMFGGEKCFIVERLSVSNQFYNYSGIKITKA